MFIVTWLFLCLCMSTIVETLMRRQSSLVECVVSENIHTQTMEGHQEFVGEGGS